MGVELLYTFQFESLVQAWIQFDRKRPESPGPGGQMQFTGNAPGELAPQPTGQFIGIIGLGWLQDLLGLCLHNLDPIL